eukprot:7865981-Pyramimonas_sp.AAC.1
MRKRGGKVIEGGEDPQGFDYSSAVDLREQEPDESMQVDVICRKLKKVEVDPKNSGTQHIPRHRGRTGEARGTGQKKPLGPSTR